MEYSKAWQRRLPLVSQNGCASALPLVTKHDDLWRTRKAHGLRWATSTAGLQFSKTVYKKYTEIFEAITKDQSRITFGKCLDNFYFLWRKQEEGELRLFLQAVLTLLCNEWDCTADDVVDCFSFVTRELYTTRTVVFNFSQLKFTRIPMQSLQPK